MSYKIHFLKNSLLCNKFRIAVSNIRRYMYDIVCCFEYAFVHIVSTIFCGWRGLRDWVCGVGACVRLDVWYGEKEAYHDLKIKKNHYQGNTINSHTTHQLQLSFKVRSPSNNVVTNADKGKQQQKELHKCHLSDPSVIVDWLLPVRQTVPQNVVIPTSA